MRITWFRMYSEMLNDPKIQTLPLASFKAYVNALCLAGSDPKSTGNIGTLETVSFAFRETKESVSSAFHELTSRGLIVTENETFHIPTWRKRQYKSDTSTDRVKRFRKRYGNVSETPSDTDTDTDTDTDIKHTPKPQFATAFAFAEFWKIYPRKIGKAAAQKAYARACRAAKGESAVLDGLRRQSELLREKGEYCPYPATWLNQGRWADETESLAPIFPPVREMSAMDRLLKGAK
jgi:hypothetical protein